MREDGVTAADREQIAAAIKRIALVPGASGDAGQDIRRRTSEIVSHELSALLDNGKTCAHRVAARSGGWGLETIAFGGPGWPQETALLFEGLVQASTEIWGFYDPERPQPEQRNVVFCPDVPPVSTHAKFMEMRAAMGLSGLFEMRMLVCDGPMLLSWVGSWKHTQFDARDAWVLRRVGRAAKRAFRMSRVLPAGVAWAGFEAALNALEIDAFVVRANGQIEFANRVGALRLENDPGAVAHELAVSLAPGLTAGPFDLHPLRLSGAPPLFLAMRGITPGRALEARLTDARASWRLTPRHVSIVRLLARGDANKDIALKLGLSPGTVEVYVTEIFRRAKVESRLQLVAKLWA